MAYNKKTSDDTNAFDNIGSMTTKPMMQALNGLPKIQQAKVLFAVHQYVLYGVEETFKNNLVHSIYLALREEPKKQYDHAMKNAKAKVEKVRRDAEAQSMTATPEDYSGTESSSEFNQLISQSYPNLANVRVPLTQEAYDEAVETAMSTFHYQTEKAEDWVCSLLDDINKWNGIDKNGDANVMLSRFVANRVQKYNIDANC